MRRIVIIVDMQNDFVTGSLGSKEAERIVPFISKKISEMNQEDLYATRDTHHDNYLQSSEGTFLPVVHCMEGSEGWQIVPQIAQYLDSAHILNKPSFGSMELCRIMRELAQQEPIEIELVGVCTDICVVSNALLLKAALPETPIYVDSSCCAGVTEESHEAALLTMKSCQIHVY